MDVLFIHGGGDRGYEADEALAASLKQHLGAGYDVRYPRMPEEKSPDFGWEARIDKEVAASPGDLVLVGHSLGASMLLKYLSEHKVSSGVRGVFLLATPFWSGEEEWQKGLKLSENFASALPDAVPIFLYHNEDDEELDATHLSFYRTKLPHAIIRTPRTGGHQFTNGLELVARDIRASMTATN